MADVRDSRKSGGIFFYRPLTSHVKMLWGYTPWPSDEEGRVNNR